MVAEWPGGEVAILTCPIHSLFLWEFFPVTTSDNKECFYHLGPILLTSNILKYYNNLFFSFFGVSLNCCLQSQFVLLYLKYLLEKMFVFLAVIFGKVYIRGTVNISHA